MLMGTMEEIKEEESRLTAIIDKTHCGYCKEIVGSARDILKTYAEIIDKAEKLDEIKQSQTAYLGGIKDKADEMINAYNPSTKAQATGGRAMNRLQGPLKRVQSRKIFNQYFGDLLQTLTGE